MFRSAPNLFQGDIEDNLHHFITNYVEKFKLPRLSRSYLKPVGGSEEDGCLSSGASGSVHRYYLEVPLELEELGYHENDQEVIEKKHCNPVVIPVSVEVIVKKIFFQGLSPELSISHFLNEVEILDHFICRVTPNAKKLSDPYYAVDPNIITCYGYCYDFIQDDRDDESYQKNHFWIVLEYAQKGSLSPEIIKGLTNFERVYVSLSICEGLQTLHNNNIVYVDLKPSNILVDNHGFFKLTDFGCSVVAHETFFLFYKSDYDALKTTSYVDKYMPAIVRLSERKFKIVFKSTSFLSEKDASRNLSYLEKKQSFLTEIECPENFLDIVKNFFVRNDRFCIIPLCSPLMHFLEENGYSHSYLETVLRDENGTALWMAPEFYAGIYDLDSSHVYKRPDVSTDMYSLGITLVEVWTGEEPYVEHDNGGNIFPILRKIVSEGLRPKIHRMYSENGLVEANTLEAGDRARKVQIFIQDCWHCDPYKRPKVTVLIDFFRAWIDDILVESVTRNNIYQLKEILDKLQDPHWLLAEKKL